MIALSQLTKCKLHKSSILKRIPMSIFNSVRKKLFEDLKQLIGL
jgi:hypothetical protein